MTVKLLAILAALPLFAQTPAFEVASVKQNRSGELSISIRQRPGGGFIAHNAPLRMLLTHAYNIKPHQLSGLPAWTSDARFDIEAKADGASPAQVRQMLQTLLAERFRLAAHRETREQPIYTLVVAKGGPRLRESKAETTQMDGKGPGQIAAEKVPMAMLARSLQNILERSVVDETGLTGEYDFELNWLPDRLAEPRPGDEPRPADISGPSIFTALQEQLGLRLQAAKGPVEIVVVDRVERLTEN
jgi:uncharacterized protein (TIGR03435 family)